MGIEIAVRGMHRGPIRARKSPLTGEMETSAELEMNEDEYAAAAAVLARHGSVDENGEGRLDLTTAQIEVWGFDHEGAMMSLIGDLRGACDFLFELASAGSLAVQFESATGEACAVVTTAQALAKASALDEAAREELGSMLLAADAEALWRALAPAHAQPRGIA